MNDAHLGVSLWFRLFLRIISRRWFIRGNGSLQVGKGYENCQFEVAYSPFGLRRNGKRTGHHEERQELLFGPLLTEP